ncbi:serine/threonine-protein kinase [Megavirus baoshan]|uniref:Putative serine/threonine-protein kinase n=1 Tax=Megavirus baoshan TaxID=2496520 RepID=A0A3S8UX50_9VIRU|nr:serine/threonine-protein kinase [Megavirus baoshan]AZL89362.1 serine/threonine-protein kinase [Megavirus baoshan]
MNKNNMINTYQSNYDVSDDENEYESEIYQNALMSSLAALTNSNSNSKNSSDDNEKKPTESRIDLIKSILGGNDLKPMINLDNCETEAFVNNRLNKKIINAELLFSSMGVRLKYLKSGTTGHTFKGLLKTRGSETIAFAVKVCAYPKDDYGPMNHMKRPENVELRMIKLLSYFVVNKKSPHFVLPIGTFNTSITKFINIPKNFIDLNDTKNEMYKKFVEKYHDGEYENLVSVLISEWCNGGDLLDYIRKNYQNMNLKTWVIIIFQILFTLALVHDKYPAFRHNDMKANNILVQITDIKRYKPNHCYRYNLGSTVFIIPNIDLQVKIWDFDFSCIKNLVENNKVNSDWTNKMNITNNPNRYYDMHYFFNTLISKRFFPQFYEGGAPNEIVDFVHRIIPTKYRNGSSHVNKKGRIQVDTEFTTPYKVIMEDPLFNKYRNKINKYS